MTLAHQTLDLLAATGLSAVIGLERELNAQQAGFRTHVLVGLGSALFAGVGFDVAGSDPTRIAAQVVTGIGFLGAGAILREGGSIHGLTTAASLFVTAAAGVACGLDRPGLAAIAMAIAVLVLIVLKILEHDVFPRRRGHTVVLELTDTADVTGLVRKAAEVLQAPAHVRRVERGHSDRTVVTLSSPLAKGFDLLDLAVRLRALEDVVGVVVGGS
jgi:putative Mg2+ transporter-C (MgtC) family protein